MKETTRQHLLQGAMRVLNATPFASMDRIAEETHVSRMTLFRAFKNRQGLIEALVLESYKVCSEIIGRISVSSGTAAEKLEQTLREMMPLGPMFRFLLYSPWRFENAAINENDIALRMQWRNLLQEMRDDGLLRSDLPLDWLSRSLDSLLVAAWEGLEDGDLAPNTAHEHVLKLFFYGIMQTPNQQTAAQKTTDQKTSGQQATNK